MQGEGQTMASTATLVTSTSGSLPSVAPVQQPRAKRLTQYIAALSATLGAFALGNVLAWTSPTQASIQDGYYGFTVTDGEFAWVGSLLTIGAALSTLPTGFLVDFIGRKNTMLYIALPFAAGWAIIIWAMDVGMLYAGRIITGFCGGLFSVASPLYIGEISEKEIRGTLGTSFQLMVVIGIEFTYVVGAYVDVFVISLISGIVPLVFAVIFFWMPDSPQYHLKRNKPEEARQALQWFRGGANSTYDVTAELQEMKNSLDSCKPVPLLETFKSGAAKKAMLISGGLMVFQQLSGINAVIFYTDQIFASAGSSIDSKYSVMIVGGVQLVFTVVAAAVIDKLGRRVLLLVSFSAMSVCTVILGTYFFFQEKGDDVSSLGWLPLVTLCVYIIAFSIGAGPIPWLMLGEIFASEIKGTASSLSALINWLIAFVVTRFYADLEKAIHGSSTFYIFTGCLVVGVVFVFFVVPETRGKTLEEIQIGLEGSGKSMTQANLSSQVLGDSEKQQSHKF